MPATSEGPADRRTCRIRKASALIGTAAAILAACPANAGPPYVTDDPEPTDTGHWEIYNFATGTHVGGDTAGEAGLDLNYGAAKDLQLTLVIPASFDAADGRTQLGMGVVEAAAKFKLLHQETDGIDLAVFPRFFIPTAPARFASTRLNLLIPIWAGKDFGPWSVFGGGGYQINPGAGNRDFWTGGVAVTRDVSKRLQLGGEVYVHSRDSIDGRAFTGLNLGGIFKLTDHWSLLMAGGPGLQNARQEGQYDFYLALEATY